jgi:hypothetical protein
MRPYLRHEIAQSRRQADWLYAIMIAIARLAEMLGNDLPAGPNIRCRALRIFSPCGDFVLADAWQARENHGTLVRPARFFHTLETVFRRRASRTDAFAENIG